MVQQTAVSYIISQLRQLAFNENTHLDMGDVRVTQGLIDELEEQAKQMEKEQIIIAHCHNRCLNDKSYECSIKAFENSEQYYNQTYNQNK